jgi:hypothetical protein
MDVICQTAARGSRCFIIPLIRRGDVPVGTALMLTYSSIHAGLRPRLVDFAAEIAQEAFGSLDPGTAQYEMRGEYALSRIEAPFIHHRSQATHCGERSTSAVV